MSREANVNVKCARFVLKPQKPIQPYICWTLNDCQKERDFLDSNIFPQLNKLCNSRGTYFKAVDLRWSGLKTQAPFLSSRFRQHSCLHSQHLKLCLDYVNSCFPFFICVLGHTYGDFCADYSPVTFSKATDLSNLSIVEQNLYVAAKNGYPWVLENPNCSLVEYEIIQAAFLNESQFQYFYFRVEATLLKTLDNDKEETLPSSSLTSDEEKVKIEKLKAKITSRGLPVRFYKDLSELGELVFKDWLGVIEKLHPTSLMTEHTDYKHNFDRFYHEEFIEKCKRVFVVSKESNRIFDILERFALKDMEFDFNRAASGSSLESILRINSLPTYKSILLLTGDRGCGKSTLIASWVNDFKKKYPDVLLISHFVGSTCESCDIMSVIYYFVTELQHAHYGTQLETDILNEDSNILVFSLLVDVFIASISLKPCVLVLDGIEELVGIYGISGQKAKDFSWLPPSIAPHCKFIMSTVSCSLSYKALCARSDVKMVELSNTGDSEAKLNIFCQHFSIPHNKNLFERTRQILKKKPNMSPLKLTILANELKECRIYRDEFQCLNEYLEVISLQELWELILKRWTEDYSWTFKQTRANSDTVASGEGLNGWVADALCLLSISHGGLTDGELLQLLAMLGYRNRHKVTMLHWAAFRNAARQWVQEKPNGLLYFRHQSLRNAVEHMLLGVIMPVRESSPYSFQNPTNHKKIQFHGALVRYFGQQTAFWRVYQELPWHLKMSSCWEELSSFLSSPSITDLLSKIQSPSFWTRLHLVHYWNVLFEAGYDATRAYLSTVAKVKADGCHKMKKKGTLSVLECRLFEVTPTDKCRLLFFIGRFLKFMGKIKEARELFLDVEDMLVKIQSMREMLVKVQNTIGELYLELGLTQEGFQYFQKAWLKMMEFSSSNLTDNQDLVKQKGKVLNNLAKSASEEYLKENNILDYVTDISSLLDNNPRDQADMKYTEGVLILATGNTCLAMTKFHECLNIRKSLFGEKNMLVGEVLEILADLLFFPLRDYQKFIRKKAIEYYKQVIDIKEIACTLTNSLLIKKQLGISLSDTLCKLAGQLLIIDTGHPAMMEAVGYLYRSLDLRATHLGPAHSSIHGILHLLREIEHIRDRRCWPQGLSQHCSAGPGGSAALWEYLLKLSYHSTQGSPLICSIRGMNVDMLHRDKSTSVTPPAVPDKSPHMVSDKSKCTSGKGKKVLRPMISISDEEKTQRKMQNNVEIWKGSEKEASKKKKNYSSKMLSLGKMDDGIKLLPQKILLGNSESGKGQISTIYQQPLLGAVSVDNPWESLSDLISEKWLFHTPDYSSALQKCFLPRRSQLETKLLKIANDFNKE
ncbi:putative tetratricopeptide repeat protein 41 isoform X1 [Talpa occidentalis]|uniref:putative tetratricopeptide repeat protein 41 isoform X1 n=1 Tax=Talpa occidentalis TaxID=50954 RepID=UPI00188F24AF|nr:putative tetratricopeptide repeat protein 41 isoform X1 [Talpa occidentalis]XP_037369641.1 putative tetratricopeptide repeat protein 41 isoform X1 [Talpa occidentalis]XP_037369642.1 putative tetratricopeptide repeat protein 41 isoform X1 [Talpa occidentalis]XP_037369643.1 putative tetratricopeptide repeat protein 41 isoform X1 [Talpa occidentalis]XP_037369644.1 putative tetratricopeptide repeat protein 41 isoform X1 [Talpa occidentalis]